MVALLVVGTIIGLIWADTSNVAGAFAVTTNIVGAVGIVSLLIALAVVPGGSDRASGLRRERNSPKPRKPGAERAGRPAVAT